MTWLKMSCYMRHLPHGGLELVPENPDLQSPCIRRCTTGTKICINIRTPSKLVSKSVAAALMRMNESLSALETGGCVDQGDGTRETERKWLAALINNEMLASVWICMQIVCMCRAGGGTGTCVHQTNPSNQTWGSISVWGPVYSNYLRLPPATSNAGLIEGNLHLADGQFWKFLPDAVGAEAGFFSFSPNICSRGAREWKRGKWDLRFPGGSK